MQSHSSHISHVVDDLRNGSEQALKNIFDRFGKKVFHYCKKIVGNDEDAEELVHDIFLKIWRFRSELKPEANLEVFLFTIARNHVLNFVRKKANVNAGLTELNDEKMELAENDYEPLSYKDVYRQYQAILKRLTPKSRQIFELSREQGLSHKEIAQKLGISIRTVEKHVTNVIAIMKEQLKDAYLLIILLIFR